MNYTFINRTSQELSLCLRLLGYQLQPSDDPLVGLSYTGT